MTIPYMDCGTLARLRNQRREMIERLGRCDDLFGKMLIVGKLKALDRKIAAITKAKGETP